MIGAGLLVAALLGTNPAPLEVHTATRDVRDCQAIDRGRGGFLAATDGGVVFVDADGRASAPLTIFDGLPQTRSYVIEAVADESDAWWVGSEGGLARLERRGGELRVTKSWTSASVRAVVEHDGRTYVGTWGEGVLELRDAGLVALPSPEHALGDRITALTVHADRVVAASAGAGAWIVGAEPEPIVGVEGVVWSLAVHEGTLYAGTLAGVRELDGERSITISSADARALASVDGELWIGSRGQGLTGVGSPLAAAPSVSHVQGFDRDRCVATPEGLWIRKRERWIETLATGLPAGDVTAMLEVDGALWIGTFEHGLAVYRDGSWQPPADPDHAIDPQINALASAGKGRVWVATTRGLHRVGRTGVESWTTKAGLPHQNVLSLAQRQNGELVVGTHAGVAIVDTNGDLRSLGRRARTWATWAIAEAPDGSLWLGTTQGLIHWKQDGTWDHYSMLSGQLEDNWVTALLFEGDTLHVGSYAGGVSSLRKDAEGRWAAEQLGGGRVNPGGLSLVDGELTIATMKGALVRRRGRWESLAPAPFEDVTQTLATDAGLWIASRRGLVLHERANGLD